LAEELKKNNMERKSKGTMAFKLKSQDHGGPMQKNYGIGGPLRDEKNPTDSTTVNIEPVVEKVDPMYGMQNDAGTMIVNKQGNWVSKKNSSEYTTIYRDAEAKGILSGGSDTE